MSTLLEVVNIVILENGIAGGEPITTFDSAEPEISRLIGYGIDADAEIQNAWHDWSFLWNTASVTVAAGSDVIPLPTVTVDALVSGAITPTAITAAYPWKIIDHGSVVGLPGTDSAYPIQFMEWTRFERSFERTAKLAEDYPAMWSAKPDRTLVLSALAPAGDLDVRYRYYMMPRRIPRHIDAELRVPSMLVDPSNASIAGPSRAVVELVTMKWARSEGRFDILSIAADAYANEMEKLRATYGIGHTSHMQTAANMVATVE